MPLVNYNGDPQRDSAKTNFPIPRHALREREQFRGYCGRPYTETRHVRPKGKRNVVSYRVLRPRYATGSKTRGRAARSAIWEGYGGNPYTLRRKRSRRAIPPQSCEAVVYVSQIENSPRNKYLDVQDEEASQLHARRCAAVLEVSQKAGRRESAFGIATF